MTWRNLFQLLKSSNEQVSHYPLQLCTCFLNNLESLNSAPHLLHASIPCILSWCCLRVSFLLNVRWLPTHNGHENCSWRCRAFMWRRKFSFLLKFFLQTQQNIIPGIPRWPNLYWWTRRSSGQLNSCPQFSAEQTSLSPLFVPNASFPGSNRFYNTQKRFYF